MRDILPIPRPSVPLRALWLSMVALAVPVASTVLTPGPAGGTDDLLWLLALVPAFLLAYYRGWRGVAFALAAGMVALTVTHLVLSLRGRTVEDPALLLIAVSAYIAIALGVGTVSELLHRALERAEARALTDELTGLPNRRWARLVLETEFAAAQRGRPLVVVLFDLDRFKEYNDRFGHAAGDRALCVLAAILRRNTRRMDLSARIGGEEFVSILSSAELAGARVFAERIREELARVELPTGPVRVSVGMAAYDPSMAGPDELLAVADEALYRAKQEGRDRIRVGRPRGRLEAI
ncbi:MAG TPA: GGDEF domain-containing protein [Longimicrobiales bacterium]